ncbi:hypothetical protein KP509_20G086800 [Ceratopteris richardii]|nr:hypothetical protein KP509_20G086800 [Ceratopteris richardii]
MQHVNVDDLDIERVRDMPTIPAEDLDLYDVFYQELIVPQHDTRASRTCASHSARTVRNPLLVGWRHLLVRHHIMTMR